MARLPLPGDYDPPTMAVAAPTQKSTTGVAPRFWRAWGAALLVLASGFAALAAPQEPPREPVAVSDGEHVWFFETTRAIESSRVVVLHHGPGNREEDAEQATVVEDMPEAALAVDGRLYCIFRGKLNPAGGFQNRSVSTVRAESFDPTMRTWIYEPTPRARTVADLPGAGRVAGFVADGRDPLVLIASNPQWTEEVGGTGKPPAAGSESDGAELELPRLFRLKFGREWEEVSLPETLRSAHRLTLIGGLRPVILSQGNDAAPGETVAFELGADGSWSASTLDLNADLIIGAAQLEGQTFLATQSTDEGMIVVRLLRTPHLYPVIEIEQSTGPQGLIAFNSSLAVVEVPPERDRLVLTKIDIDKGELESPLQLRRKLRPALEDFSLLVLVGALLFASLVMFVFRPADPARMTVVLPDKARIAEPRRRIIALLIDLLPAALLAGLILDVPLSRVLDFTHLPMRAHHIDEGWPMMLMFLLCIGHCTLSELLWQRTLGKVLLDCWVVGIDGKRARVTSILVRNAMKFVALCVPVLFLFVYINQYRQRLGDLAGRTIVVTHGDATEPNEADD